MKSAATLVLVMLAMSASAAVDARALAHEGPKTQWAPTRNFSSLNARVVFAGESRRATSPYAGEEWETAAGEKDWQYAAGNPTRFTDSDGRGVADLQCIASGADGCNIFGAGRYAAFAFAVRDAKRRYTSTQSVEDYKAWATISGRFEQRLLDLDERGATGPLYSGVAGVGVLVGGPALVAVGEALPAPGVLLSGAANVARGAANWAYQATVGPLVSGVRAFAGSVGAQGVMNTLRYIAGPFLAKFGLNIYDLFDESMSFSSPTGWFPGVHGSSGLKRTGENVLARKVEDLFPTPAVSPPRGAHQNKDTTRVAAEVAQTRVQIDKMLRGNDELSVIGSVVHPNVPAWSGEGPLRGVLETGGVAVPLRSGEVGPGSWLIQNLPGGPGSGLTRSWTHVEGHAVGIMQAHGIADADLFIGLAPCGPQGAAKCRNVLGKLLPEGATLRVHFPADDGHVSVWEFIGGQPNFRVLR